MNLHYPSSSKASQTLLLVFVFVALIVVCSAKSMIKISEVKMEDEVTYSTPQTVPQGGMNMFEISTRPWLYNLTQKYGKPISRLQDIPIAEFQALKNLGIDIVWMMGVWQLGQYGLNYDQTTPSLLQEYSQVLPGYTMADIIGSPYAVVNYTTNSEIGSDADLLALKKNLNQIGLLLMLDFVPNHTAVDCPWTTTNPDYFIRAPKGTSPPYNSNLYLPNGIAYGSSGYGAWFDTAQLNYWNPNTTAARLQELLHVASLSDAIRCDMAYLLLNELFAQTWATQLSSWGYTQPEQEWWVFAISAVKKVYPNIIFLGEVYSPYEIPLQNVGFDYTYDKQVHDFMGSNNLDGLRWWLSSNTPSYFQHAAHFVSNHDEERGATFFGSWYQSDAAAILSYTLPGLRFFWMGDFDGYKYQLDIHLRREQSEPVIPEVFPIYQNLFSIINDPVFRTGQWQLSNVTQDTNGWALVAYRWWTASEKRLCVINYSAEQAWGSIVIPNATPINGNDTIPITDLLSGTTYWRSAKEVSTIGLEVGVNSWWAQIFKY